MHRINCICGKEKGRKKNTLSCIRLVVFVHVCVCTTLGQAPWKLQQRSSAFKWIKTQAQSPGPAGIGQTGCSLDEDLRLIISHAAFVFAATVACTGNTAQNMDVSAMKQILTVRSAAVCFPHLCRISR